MKTYSEAKGRPVFDWNEALDVVIQHADKGIKIETDYYIELKEKAGSWVTCACGNQCDVIPRNKYGSPLDSRLSNLGHEFYDQISDEDFLGAMGTLQKIEKRSATLIAKYKTES